MCCLEINAANVEKAGFCCSSTTRDTHVRTLAPTHTSSSAAFFQEGHISLYIFFKTVLYYHNCQLLLYLVYLTSFLVVFLDPQPA